MRAAFALAALLAAFGLAGCAGESASYDAAADRAAVRDVISSAWKAESASDENTACLYFTEKFITEQNRIWESGTPGAAPQGKDCARGRHPYLRLTNVGEAFVNDRLGFAWTRVSHKSRTAMVHPILPGETRCLNPDCQVVISLVIHLVDKKGGGWLIDDLDASACEVDGACVPLIDRTLI